MLGNSLIIKKKYHCSIKELWNAITNPNALKDWFFEVENFELEEGNKFKFYAGEYLHLCEIKEIFLYHKLVYSWTYPYYQGDSLVTFIITPSDTEHYTNIELIHEGLATFPQDDINFSLDSFEAGWEDLLEIALKKYVELK